MKKVLVVLLIITALAGAYLLWLKWSPDKFIDGYYLVPDDAVMVIETEDPVAHWQNFSASGMWQGVKSFPAFAKITKNADMLDELIKSNQQVFAVLGQKHLLISIHMTKAKDYDFVYYADMKEASKSDVIKASLTSIIRQFDYVNTVREFNGVEINEFLDPKSRDVLSIAFVNNYLVCTYNKLLMDKVISTSAQPERQSGLNPHFTEVNRLTSADGMCRLFINYNTFHQYLGVYMDDVTGLRSLFSGLHYTGLDCSLEEDLLLADGYTLVDDSMSTYLQALAVSGKSATDAEKVFSEKASFFFSMGFSDFNTFYSNLQKLIVNHSEDYREQQTALRKLERMLGINMQKHFFDWIGSEVAIAQYETDVLIGNKVRNIMAIKARDINSAKENLAFIEKQIRKRSPVRFTDVIYKGYDIKYLEVKGLFKAVLGKLFSKIEKPYYTVIDDFVVFSDDPRTLLLTIDDFIAQKTLFNRSEFREFRSRFADQTSVMAYLSPNHHFANFKGLLNAESWKSTQKHQVHVRCFEHCGMSLSGDGDRMRTVIATQYLPWKEKEIIPDTGDSETDTLTALDLFLISNFQGNMNTVYYENGNPKTRAEMDGTTMDGAYMEYYENAVIKVKGRYRNGLKTGTWKYYKPDGKFDYKEKYIDGVLKKLNILERIFGSDEDDA